MKKSLFAAAALAAVSFGAANVANAATIGSGFAGLHAGVASSLAEKTGWHKRGHKKWVCNWRHGHKHCHWRKW